MSNNMGLQSLPSFNRRTLQMEPSPRGQNESSETVRSKLRESLSSALALVTSKPLSEEKPLSCPSESIANQVTVCSHQSASFSPIIGEPEILTSNDPPIKHNNSELVHASHKNTENSAKNDVQGQFKSIFSEDEGPFSDIFIMKDEFLQGNGLCWVSDFDVVNNYAKNSPESKRLKVEQEEITRNTREQEHPKPQILAAKIEAELFKLFGGVNKKYKEKGRSLLFNLKDRNNPELRERVMSGDIVPERLCCMTAEELASKELSNWRIAKAEELAQMVFLPDSEVDVRRLVKKTHKGEFQVEVDKDDDVSEEIALGTSSFSKIPHRTIVSESQSFSKNSDSQTNVTQKPNETKTSGLVDENNTYDIDTVEQLMDGDLKDVEFLPPIVSLDEFMESLDVDPPSIPIANDQSVVSSSEKGKLENSISELEKLDSSVIDGASTVQKQPDNIGLKYATTDSNPKPTHAYVESDNYLPDGVSLCERVWRGSLQLSVSSLISLTGYFRSGEKTSTKDWPNIFEVKGRVRVDAFEKFLHDLPQSRTRAMMILQFCLGEGCSESERSDLVEAVDSYIIDERLGFAEPYTGVEIYFCPPYQKTVEMLKKYLPKDHGDPLDVIKNGIIGLVVWRRSSPSPRMSTNHKTKKLHGSSKRHRIDKDEKSSQIILPANHRLINQEPLVADDDSIDDVPPGFGPVASKEEDDLPEFDFVCGNEPSSSQFSIPSNSNAFRTPDRPVDQMRELVHKYGQSNKNAEPSPNLLNWSQGIEMQPWNENDDDIPEWQPEQNNHRLPQPPPPRNQHVATLPPGLLPGRPLVPVAAPMPMALQPPLPMVHQPVQPSWQMGGWWSAPQLTSMVPIHGSMQPCHFGSRPQIRVEGRPDFSPGQNSVDWRRKNVPGGRR